jgi:hypothetical protein
MTPTFKISAGTLMTDLGTLSGVWSGHGYGQNNPAACAAKGIGPLPPGTYTVGPLEASHARLGPNVLPLTQTAGQSYGRGSFYIHGADVTNPANSSDGCIIMPPSARLALDRSYGTAPRLLEVVA